MEACIGLLLLGIAVGAYGTMIGAGGGFVLVPLLLLLYRGDTPPKIITAISLAVVLVNAASGTIAYARMRRVHYRAGVIFAVATLPGAVLGAIIVDYLPRRTFSLIMGGLLVLIAIFLALRPSEEDLPSLTAPSEAPPPGARSWPNFPFNKPLGVAISMVVGFISSILGVGGGIIHVPANTYLLRFPVHVATATSHFVLVFTALAATLVHVCNGDLHGMLSRTVPLAIGVIPGAQLGAILARKVHGAWILRLLAGALGLVGLRLLVLPT